MFVLSIILIIIIFCCRKRREFLYWATPLSFMISGILGVYLERIELIETQKGNKNPVETIAILLGIHYMFYMIGHQFFAS